MPKERPISFYRIPRIHYDFMSRRVGDLIDTYGRGIRHISLEELAVSCYAQGIQDALQALERRDPPVKT